MAREHVSKNHVKEVKDTGAKEGTPSNGMNALRPEIALTEGQLPSVPPRQELRGYKERIARGQTLLKDLLDNVVYTNNLEGRHTSKAVFRLYHAFQNLSDAYTAQRESNVPAGDISFIKGAAALESARHVVNSTRNLPPRPSATFQLFTDHSKFLVSHLDDIMMACVSGSHKSGERSFNNAVRNIRQLRHATLKLRAIERGEDTRKFYT